jgi:hypothetical protein
MPSLKKDEQCPLCGTTCKSQWMKDLRFRWGKVTLRVCETCDQMHDQNPDLVEWFLRVLQQSLITQGKGLPIVPSAPSDAM